MAPNGARFLYHGDALAFGGRVTRPYAAQIEPQAAVVLPIIGGYGNVRVDNFRFLDLVSFRSATSTVAGSEVQLDETKDAMTIVYNTLVSTTIEDLNVRDVVTADRIVARLVSEHTVVYKKGAELTPKAEVPITLVSSRFENLRVAGTEIVPRLQEALCTTPTIAALKGAAKKKALTAVGATGTVLEPPSPGESVVTSLFERPDVFPAGCSADECSWGIKIDGFGTVFLGEVILAHGTRRLTMLHIKMGSPEEADLVVGGGTGNGSTYP
jgi:hypothetical protein